MSIVTCMSFFPSTERHKELPLLNELFLSKNDECSWRSITVDCKILRLVQDTEGAVLLFHWACRYLLVIRALSSIFDKYSLTQIFLKTSCKSHTGSPIIIILKPLSNCKGHFFMKTYWFHVALFYCDSSMSISLNNEYIFKHKVENLSSCVLFKHGKWQSTCVFDDMHILRSK